MSFIDTAYLPESDLRKFGQARGWVIGANMALLLLVVFPFFWLTVWRGKNWARWFLFISWLVSVALFVRHIALTDAPYLHAIDTVETIINAVAFYFVFTGDARPWFAR